MAKRICFSGDELEFLAALDRTGCVLTDDGTFLCDLENERIAMRSRLPARIKGTCCAAESGWEITCRVLPAPKTLVIGGLFLATFLCCLLIGNYSSAVLFGILTAALAVNFAAQKNGCLKRFEAVFRGI